MIKSGKNKEKYIVVLFQYHRESITRGKLNERINHMISWFNQIKGIIFE